MFDEKFIEAYWLFRTRKISSLREMGKYLGHSEYYHKSIYSKAKKYEESKEYQTELKKRLKEDKNIRGAISTKECFNEKSRGRKREKGITDEFKKAYWDYENYLITPQQAYTRIGYSKNWFYKIAKLYEESEEFKQDIKAQKGIQKKPCRVQIIPKGFADDSKTMTVKELSKKYNLIEIQVKRLILKLDKKNIWKCIKEYSK